MSESKGEVRIIANSKIEVNLDLCTKCASCVRECPLRLFIMKDNALKLNKAADILCMECGHCVAACPATAIVLKNFPQEQVVEISKEFQIPSYDTYRNLVMARRSVRQFKEKPIPETAWRRLLEIGRYTPTGHNDQLVHFTVVRDQNLLKQISDEITKGFIKITTLYKEDRKKFKELKQSMSRTAFNILKYMIIPGLPLMLKGMEQGEDFWRWHGELLIIHAHKKTTTLIEDCSVAAAHIMLAAKTLGLGTCSLGIATSALEIFNTVRQLVNLPKNHIVAYTLAVGIPKIKYLRIPPRQQAKATWL